MPAILTPTRIHLKGQVVNALAKHLTVVPFLQEASRLRMCCYTMLAVLIGRVSKQLGSTLIHHKVLLWLLVTITQFGRVHQDQGLLPLGVLITRRLDLPDF